MTVKTFIDSEMFYESETICRSRIYVYVRIVPKLEKLSLGKRA